MVYTILQDDPRKQRTAFKAVTLRPVTEWATLLG